MRWVSPPSDDHWELSIPRAWSYFEKFIENAACRPTTDISAEYLHYACRGMVTGIVRELLVALDRSNTVAVLDAVHRLSRYGHTSGMDCVLGSLWDCCR